MIRSVNPTDASVICDIYNYYVENTTISFDETLIQVSEMEERIRKAGAKYPCLLWEEGSGEVNGYASLGPWKERSAYKFSSELSIYVRNGFQGRGIGGKLMERLLEEGRAAGFHFLIAGIALPNERSVALHEKFGFRKTAHFSEVGFKFDKWLDVGYWELLLND